MTGLLKNFNNNYTILKVLLYPLGEKYCETAGVFNSNNSNNPSIVSISLYIDQGTTLKKTVGVNSRREIC